jgi:hypothetical protein
MSLTSSLYPDPSQARYSSFHLTPQVFTHFWSWWAIFDRRLSPAVRRGNILSGGERKASPKFGRFLATIKYQLTFKTIFISHVYFDDSKDAWLDGVTPRVGTKALIEDFSADFHQREEETQVLDATSGASKAVRRKPFTAAEVTLRGLDLRALLGIYPDPLKSVVPLDAAPQSSQYRKRTDLPTIDHSSRWYDAHDFVELDWKPDAAPTSVHVLPAASVPQFTYFKRAHESKQGNLISKFGSEHTHVCLLGKRPCTFRQDNCSMPISDSISSCFGGSD